MASETREELRSIILARELEKQKQQLSAAQAEIERLREDAERYHFVKRQYVQTHSPKMDGTCGFRFTHGWPALSGATFDEAVDFAKMVVDEAARAAGGTP